MLKYIKMWFNMPKINPAFTYPNGGENIMLEGIKFAYRCWRQEVREKNNENNADNEMNERFVSEQMLNRECSPKDR